MKKLLPPVFAVSALLLNSCSTTQLARQADSNDDVYYTEAKAKVIQPAPERVQSSTPNKSYRTDEQLYGDEDSDNGYRNNRYDDDYSYSSRLNRFYYNSPYRPYYDYSYSYGYNPWYSYSYDPFFYDPWLYRPGISIWVSTGRYRSPYNYGYYGSRYNNGYWGPYSYYNTYPGYGSGYGNGSGGYYNGNNRNYNPRPSRGGNDSYQPSTGSGTIVTGGGRRGSAPVATDRISRDNNGQTSNSPSSRPRTSSTNASTREREADTRTTSRPARAERPAQTERYTPPPSTRETYTPPPSNNGSSERSSGRPSRGGN